MRVLKLLLAGALGVGLAVGGVVQASPAAAEMYVDDVPVDGWDVNGRVLATEIVGDVVYVGGNFTAAISPTGARVTRNRLAAFSMITGELITGWRADAGAGVTSLASDGEALYVGGHFGRINNVVRTRLAKVSLATGAVDRAFVASADAGVRAVAVRGDDLYVGGAFLAVNGVAKNRVAKLDARTGALATAFRASASGPVYSLVAHPRQDVVYAAGPFAQLNGTARAGVGGLDGTTGATTGPAFASSARPTLALDVDDDGSRLFGAGGSGANEISAWSTATGARSWRVASMGDNQAIEHFRGTVFAGFHDGFRNDNSVKVVAIDAATGAVDADWRPRVNEFWGVFAIDASDAGVVVGGDFRSVSGVPTGYVARFGAAAPPPPAPSTPTPATAAG
ncbi:hypothetical protein [Nocardioides sp. TF02-7]|uniref:hypothetical protein n=1 Tax=Nocardioides sp. TF02-7 TaxID=2917724 RepID=UPI001F06D0E1|nr:hypothetical protein [Nocardioides sp. TF02-7]UMG93949.1 hypothetical protein MF408_07615 [Nocardioides sp. TF02-7]